MRAAGAGPTEWVVVIPVKRLDRAKTRLSTRPAPQRGALALAFALDTVRAALACPRVSAVLVVTDDDEVRASTVALGARSVLDAPDAGLPAAVGRAGALHRASRAW